MFTASYWPCKQEIAQSKLNSMLEMVESLGVDEVKKFRRRSSTVLRDFLLTIGNQIKIGLLDKIRKSEFFGILTDEVTDISNVQNLVKFIKYYTWLSNYPWLFGKSDFKLETRVAKFKSIFIRWSICNDGFQRRRRCKTERTPELERFVNVHCICHRLALACAGSSNQLNFLKEFELTLTQLWAFFNNSPKRLNIYLKTACNMHNMETLPDNKRKNVAKKVKKAVNRRWFSLHASVDGVCEEYNGLLEKFSIL